MPTLRVWGSQGRRKYSWRVSLVGPKPVSSNPVTGVVRDWRSARKATVPLPPGELSFSLERTRRLLHDPLGLVLDGHERYGRVFSLRVLHLPVVFVLGPEANHHVLVSNAENFSWRKGRFQDLIPLLGDGLLTIDGDFHRRSRRIMLPAFGKQRIAAATAPVLDEARATISTWRDGERMDLDHEIRELALRIAMRVLFGLDPDRSPRGLDVAGEFERALAFYGNDYLTQTLRGPGTPFQRMRTARKRLDTLIFGEINRRRNTGARGEDLLSLLLDATDEDGSRLFDQHIRDEVMTLLFAGHDTTTATISFLFYELARHPEIADALRAERDAVIGDADPSFGQLMGGGLPLLDQAIDETLRLYPPAWVGPRMALRPFELHGVRIPAGVPVNYCSWASHHLPDVWDAPREFRPSRFAPAEKAKLAKGAYVPFGGGSRTCIGMRFGQLEIKVIASLLLRDWDLSLPPGFQLRLKTTPTIQPKGGLPVVLRART